MEVRKGRISGGERGKDRHEGKEKCLEMVGKGLSWWEGEEKIVGVREGWMVEGRARRIVMMGEEVS